MILSQRRPAKFFSSPNRPGFTLVELLIVIAILVILLSMTLVAVNFTRDADRVSGAASQIQSFLSGARDRAIFAKAPRGVRFFLEADNPRAVSSMVYIDPSENWSDGVIQLQRWDPNNDGVVIPSRDTNMDGVVDHLDHLDDINGDTINDDPTLVWVVAGAGTGWWELKRRGMLFDGMRIRIPKGPQGNWYPINTRLIDTTSAAGDVQRLVLGIPFRDPGDTPKEKAQAFDAGGPEDYEIQLPPRILPMEPVILPHGTVIDLDASKLPDAWRPFVPGGSQSSGNLQYSQYMDVVYSQRGNIIGSAAAGGVIHFYVCDNEDSLIIKEEYATRLLQDPPNPPYDPSHPGDPPALDDAYPRPSSQDWNIFNQQIRTGAFIAAGEIDSVNPNSNWAARLAPPGKPFLPRDRRVVTVFTQTGAVSVHPLNATDGDLNGFADDPFFFAETGESAK